MKIKEPCNCKDNSYTPYMSDINVNWKDTLYWWKCDDCGAETEHTEQRQELPE